MEFHQEPSVESINYLKDTRMEVLFIALGFLQILSVVARDADHRKATKYNKYPYKHARSKMPADRMMRDNREELLEIVTDMRKDARYKNRQTDGPRLIHRKSYSYEIGFSLGIIRETYNHMLSIHRMVQNKYNKKASYPTLFYGDYRLIEYFNNYEIVHRDEVKIDKLCELIIAVDIYDLETRDNLKPYDDDASQEAADYTRTTMKKAPEKKKKGSKKKRPFGRSDTMTTKMDSEETSKRKEEAKHKSMMRQAYLMRKMGLPPNASTTMKRFQNGWPVEETWDDYNSRYWR